VILRLLSLTLVLSLVSEPALALRPAGLEESPVARDQMIGALTGGLEEAQKMIQRGWRQIGMGLPEEASKSWLRVVRTPAIEALYADFHLQIDHLAASPRTRDLPLPDFLKTGLAQVDQVLSDSEAELRAGRTVLEHWRRLFRSLEEQKKQLDADYRARGAPVALAAQLARLPGERERLIYLREIAGFHSPHELEKEAKVSWGTLSRAEAGTRGMGSAESRDRARFILEGKLNLPLTLTFKPLSLPLSQDVNSIGTVEQRFRFILEDLLGWSYQELVRRARQFRVPGDPPLDFSEPKTSFDRMRPVNRRFFRDALQQGLREQYGPDSTNILDGNLRIWDGSLEDALRSFTGVRARLDWLMGGLLIWSGTKLKEESGVMGHVVVRPPPRPSRPSLERWALLRGGLEKGLREMNYTVVFGEDLLPVPVSAGAEEDWADLSWFWKLEPWQREQLLYGVPGTPGFRVDSWGDWLPEERKRASAGIVSLAEIWRSFRISDPTAVSEHVRRGDFFNHLSTVEFSEKTAPWAWRFRQALEAIQTRRRVGFRNANLLLAYLSALSRFGLNPAAFRLTPQNQGEELDQVVAQLASDRGYAAEDLVLPVFLDLRQGFLRVPDERWRKLSFDQLQAAVNSVAVMALSLDFGERIRFASQILKFLVEDEPQGWLLQDFPIETFWGRSESYSFPHARVRQWVSEKKLSERDAFFILMAIRLSRPEFLKNLETPGAVVLAHKLFFLPPEGGKLLVVEHKDRTWSTGRPLSPFWTAEDHADYLAQERQAGRLGRAYVHQMTVQGRLPDEFKYVAVALVLNSPYFQDWNDPFFSADWGKVAPLIHDGGLVETKFNPLWGHVKGRTDYLQRVAVVYEPKISELERLPEADLRNRLRADPELKKRYELEQMERDRLFIEARAYQRLALALHAKLGTAPAAIPEEIRDRLTARWGNFKRKMDGLLGEVELARLVGVPWFLDAPRPLSGIGDDRHEAPWQPIKEELLKANELLEKDPLLANGIRATITALLKTAADDIDQDIGLPSAGAEEESAAFAVTHQKAERELQRAVSFDLARDLSGFLAAAGRALNSVLSTEEGRKEPWKSTAQVLQRKLYRIRNLREGRGLSYGVEDPRIGLSEAVRGRIASREALKDMARQGAGELKSELMGFLKQWRGLKAGAEEGSAASPEVPLLNLDERPMSGPDYDPGVGHAPVLEIQAQNRPGPQWKPDEFFGYDLAEKAAVVIRDVERNKICAFLAYERHEPHDEDLVPEPREIEIRHLGIHPDYWGIRQVEEALLRPFLEENPRVPVVMEVSLRDRNTQQVLVRLGFESTLLPSSDWIRFVLPSEGTDAGESLDFLMKGIWDQVDSGGISLKEAAIRTFGVLEQAAEGMKTFTNWRYAWQVLALGEEEGLGAAEGFRLLARRTLFALFSRTPQDLQAAWASKLKLFRDHTGLAPSDYLRVLWGMAEDRRLLRNQLETGVRVPERAVFFAFINRVVDDWPLIERQAREHPLMRDMDLYRIEVAEGEDVVEKALSLAREYAVPGSRITAGFALGVLSEEEALRLQESWPGIETTDDPWLNYSVRYVPQEVLEGARSQGKSLMPTISSQFSAWIADPRPGIWPVLPKVTLPEELWRQFEKTLTGQVGLEEAA